MIKSNLENKSTPHFLANQNPVQIQLRCGLKVRVMFITLDDSRFRADLALNGAVREADGG